MLKNSRGYTEVFVLVIVILGAFFLAGGQLLFQNNDNFSLSQPEGNSNAATQTPTPTSRSAPIPTPVTCESGSWILKATAFCEGNVSNIKYNYKMPDGIRAVIETYQNPDGHLNPSGLEDMSSWVGGPPYLIGEGTYVAKGNRLSPPNNGLRNNYEYATEYHNGSITTVASLMCSLKIKTLGCPVITPTP